MTRLIIVSNRLPVTVAKTKDGIVMNQSVGGIATGMSSFHGSMETLWIGWCGIESEKLGKDERKLVEKRLMKEHKSVPVFLTRQEVADYYEGFCNKTVWPLFHYFVQYAEYDKWKAYRKVNEMFCERVAEHLRDDDVVWIHDYHLMLLPQMLRKRKPGLAIGFFLHIPFPSFEVFRLIPWRREMIQGLLGADLVGFHQYDYVKHFLDSVQFLTGHDHNMGVIDASDRIVKADAFPMGIDYKRYSGDAKKASVRKEIERIRKQIGDRKVILSIDRLDYTKGIVQRLEAYDSFLQKNPEQRGEVTMMVVAVPSRTGVEHYMSLKKRLDQVVGDINGRYGTVRWQPVVYMRRKMPYDVLLALYRTAEIALVTPLRDGMNLVAKEYIAAKEDDGHGVLILSEMAGAAKELGESLIVNPNSKDEICEALERAIEMEDEEKAERMQSMQERIKRYDVMRWARDFVGKLEKVKESQEEMLMRKMTGKTEKLMKVDYEKALRRLIMLDYDGTLVPIAAHPSKAVPGKELYGLLESLAGDPRNDVVIISGRKKETLEEWFGDMGVDIIAEHGVWVKESGKEWELIEPLGNDWKEEVRQILEQYVDRTPGSFIEEKDFSLVWHYRKVDADLASVRAWELKDDLMHLTANLDLGILEGKKVIEVKKDGINKGRAGLRWLERGGGWDFILSAGDDKTDEDLFSVLPEHAYSLKIGGTSSNARFIVENQEQMMRILKDLRGKSRRAS